MASKTVFAPASKAMAANTNNEAGGRAYASSPEHALAQYAATGTFGRTFYVSEGEQLSRVITLANQADPAFVAKTAVFARERALMKDMPAFLLAVLAARDVHMLARVFARVVDNGKMLRNFVQIVRSGAVGRKSFGSAPKRLLRAWFAGRSPETIFRQSLGNAPSMKDVIKMVRPSPKAASGEVDVVREALYGYLIGKDVRAEVLPATVQAFEAFKKGEGELPDVPFEMLTALGLDTRQWATIAERMTFTQLRMNLNTLLRHGVFADPSLVARVASKLRDPGAVRRARVFPYQLMATFRAASAEMPGEITRAVQEAMEIAIENVPVVVGKVYLAPDVSGSMHSAVTGFRKGATSAVRCIDVAALVSAAFLRRNASAEVIPFSDDVVTMAHPLNPMDSVMTNAERLASLPSGGTACSAPLRAMNRRKVKGDLVVYISDNQSWVDFRGHGAGRATAMADEWEIFRARNPNAKLVLIDLQPSATTQMYERSDVLNVGGFSDAVFDLIAQFVRGELDAAHWVSTIQSIPLA